jgi:ABC-type lipoprotein export system ATPase subunit
MREKGANTAQPGAEGSASFPTLMHIIGCLGRPSQGRVYSGREDASALSEDKLPEIRDPQVGFIFHSFNLLRRTAAVVSMGLPLLYAGESRG